VAGTRVQVRADPRKQVCRGNKDGEVTAKPIEEIREGDEVVSRNPDTGKTEFKRVLKTSVRTLGQVLAIRLADARSGRVLDTITATAEHPFYVVGNGFVHARGLAIGNAIVTRAGPALIVKSVEWHHRPQGYTVYNFSVEDDHTYFVGVAAGGVWVHNSVGPNRIDPWGLKFTQSDASWFFRDGHNIGETAQALREGSLEDLPPVQVYEENGLLWSMDNRRVLAYRSAGKDIPYEIVDKSLMNHNFTSTDGGDTIAIRSIPDPCP
jgi:hypothetical protein